MKKFIQNIIAASIVIASASTVYAQSRGYSSYSSSVSFGSPNEIIINMPQVSTRGTLTTGKECKADRCPNLTNITIGANYLRTINSNVQAGAQAQIYSTSGGTSETLLTLVALGVYNFDTTFKEAFFAQGGIGIYPVLKDDGTGHESKFGFMIGGGKRFPLWGNVNYIPSVSLVKRGDLDIGFDIEFANFSVMF